MKKVLFILMAFLCVSNAWGIKTIEYVLKMDTAYVDDGTGTAIDKDRMSFNDGRIDITFSNGYNKMDFVIENKTGKTISLDWDGAVWVNFNGYTDGVIHSGNSYLNKGISRAPSNIISGTKLSDLVAPKSKLDNQGSLWSIFAGMFEYNMWEPYKVQAKRFMRKHASEHIGKKFTIMLPITIDGEVKEYRFTFVLDEIRYKKMSTKNMTGE